jgi:tetratricopeptide (TPR) repeat protein
MLSFASGEQEFLVRETQDITVYGRGSLCWDSVARAAAFVTSTDPTVASFARPLLTAFEEETQRLGRPGHNLLQALVLFEALKQHGVRYVADANTPYNQVAGDRTAVDHVQYPAQLLQGKAGDCDDLTVLYAALLENAGIATALVDYPGHIFLLFDSGVGRQEGYKLPVGEERYLLWGERLWLPVEITRLHQSFAQAWQGGAEALARLSELELRERVVATAVAWERYPATALGVTVAVPPPDPAVLETSFEEQYAGLRERIDAYIEARYLYPLREESGHDGLRTQLLRVYTALCQYDRAIRTGTTYLLEERGDPAATHNHLGIAYYLQGEMTQAAYHFKQAAALRPDDPGIQRNLQRALQALGGGVSGRPEPSVEMTAKQDSKAEAVDVDESSFYWME